MKEYGGWAFPDHEVHLLEWMQRRPDPVAGRMRYQGKKQDAALAWCKLRRAAVDVGAHIGLWSFYLARQFDKVVAFEPVAEHRECFIKNVLDQNDVMLYPCALGDHEGSIAMHTSVGSSGDSWVNGDGDIPMKALDSFDLQDVDFIKIDCEGGELAVLKGAEQTLRHCKPCVIVEQKPGRAQKFGLGETAAVDYLQSLGAVLRKTISGDYILSWD